jgi:hypothetical protein
LLIALISAINTRIVRNYHQVGPLDGTNFGYCDFHNGIYWPAVAIKDRVSPYGQEYSEKYPVDRATPFYLPSTFLLHAPFGWIDLKTGEAIYFAIMIGLVSALALVTLSASGIQYSVGWCAAVMILIVTSRPGYGTLFSGYFTFELAVATVLALHWGNRPGWGGAMLAVAACKPTYAIPLAVLMIARGHWRAVLVGVALAILGSTIIYFWLLPDRSWFFLLEDIRFGQSQHMADRSEMPEFNWTRVDIVAVIAKWLKANPGEGIQVAVFLVACLVPAFIVWRLRKHPESENVSSLSGTISLLTMNALLYRHYYDLIVLVVPIVTLAVGSRQVHREFSTWMRFVIAGLLLIALFNYGSTLSFFGRFGIEQGSTEYLLLTSLSGCALFAALILALATGLQRISQGHPLKVDSSSALP